MMKSERLPTEAEQLKETLLAFIAEEAGMVKGLAAQSKKDLAREVVHLRGLVKTIKEATSRVRTSGPEFGHAEAFMLMTYARVEGEGPDQLLVWNSRDGVTPFVVNIGASKYQHAVSSMQGPHFDLPRDLEPTHKWVTRTDREVLEAWHRTMDKAVELGKIERDKAEAMRDNLEVAESWHYRIGLVNLATGRFTDDEVLTAASALTEA
ncbi:hypothetical protein P9A57_gp01 [Pseudomonas phage phiH1]|uniref:Uncharacterized protein n=1 Tax=Pseudomonas phage phiH1 TaxID=2982871 RepID=A0AAX3D1M6_9CAUD|nr:hypothetical protein P9A57_gp01 [Pseudomonas phage phiH1]UYD21567.1 hypothetical protein [Pseudomonas phage phiH1]WGH15529.1 hypothetical protein [Pseudomonas phage PA_LZ02]